MTLSRNSPELLTYAFMLQRLRYALPIDNRFLHAAIEVPVPADFVNVCGYKQSPIGSTVFSEIADVLEK